MMMMMATMTSRGSNELILSIRKNKGISRYELSKLSGVAESTIRNWEMEGCAPPIDKYIKALDALGYELSVKEKVTDNNKRIEHLKELRLYISRWGHGFANEDDPLEVTYDQEILDTLKLLDAEIDTLRTTQLLTRWEEAKSKCANCKHEGKYVYEREYGYPSPCTCCARIAIDNYERKDTF